MACFVHLPAPVSSSLLFILLFALSRVSSKLILFHGSYVDNWTADNRKLMCVSEDDGSALVWNSNLIWRTMSYRDSDRKSNMAFYEYRANNSKHRQSSINCPLTSFNGCTLQWYMKGWTLTNSISHPMGPVFDRRWEDFKENEYSREYRLIGEVQKSSSTVISVRGSDNAHFLLCNGTNYASSFCYWFIIGGWDNSRSIIRKCPSGVPPDRPLENTECDVTKAIYRHAPLSATEWRTFIFTWNNTSGNLSVFDTNTILLNYVDKGPLPNATTDTYQMFVRSLDRILLRIHEYSFLYTNDIEAILESPEIYVEKATLCLEMVIGLCADCEMKIVLTVMENVDYSQTLVIVKGSSVTANHGLPMWQYVRINKTIDSKFSEKFSKLKMIQMATKDVKSPFWAVTNVKECSPIGTVRIGSMQASQDYDNNYYWPNVTCQKIFYDGGEVVSSINDISRNLKQHDTQCPMGTLGPFCAVSCSDHLGTGSKCAKTIICYSDGCTCSPGFVGSICSIECPTNKYGYACQEYCGHCQIENCNFITGKCAYGCNNDMTYHVPPYCKIEIGKPPAPNIDFINETYVRASIVVTDEYKETTGKYVFRIQKEGSDNIRDLEKVETIYKNNVIMNTSLDDLKPGKLYWIWSILNIEKMILTGDARKFMTKCTPSTNFGVNIKDTSLIIKIEEKLAEYLCPPDWYNVLIRENVTGKVVVRLALPDIPYEFLGLTPYTAYEVIVNRDNGTFFKQKIQTLEGMPSSVTSLRTRLSNEDVELLWDPPIQPNGKIVKYEIKWQVTAFCGCEDQNLSSKLFEIESSTTTSTYFELKNLHPYAKYMVTVAAWTSLKRGIELKTEFVTKATDLPWSKFYNLRFVDNVLYWDLPQDCTTITGSIEVTKLIIKGVSEAAKNFYEERQTKNRYFNLTKTKKATYGVELYKVKIFPIRTYSAPYNLSTVEEIVITTPPKAPPPVRNFEIYEVNFDTTTASMRWQQPLPPNNGELDRYLVNVCSSLCEKYFVKPEQKCELWDDYICTNVKLSRNQYNIYVMAYNKNVTEVGETIYVRYMMHENLSEAPKYVTVQAYAAGVVNVSWPHPWRTGSSLKLFYIYAKMISTNLREEITSAKINALYKHEVTSYKRIYVEQLNLLPSSVYSISVQPISANEQYGKRKSEKVTTPTSISFEGPLEYEVYESDAIISLRIPKIANDTKSSIAHVVVKGSYPCQHHSSLGPELSQQADVMNYEIAWRAATFSTDEYAGKTFSVGDNRIYGDATNCPLKSEESYMIVVVVQANEKSMNDQTIVARTILIYIGEPPKKHYEAWLIPIAIVLLILAAAFYIYRRRTRNVIKNIDVPYEMPLSEKIENFENNINNTKSKTSTLTLVPTPTSDKDSLSSENIPHAPTVLAEEVQEEDRKTLVKVKDFEDYVRKSIKADLLDKQYDMFPRGQTKSWDYGKLPQNKSKNRYANLIAYDETRVVLQKLADDPYSDYINANYIKGYKKDRHYIATQGPKNSTVVDFWRMVWQEDVLIICMLANVIEGGKTKCEQYWPDIGKRKKYGEVTVLNAKHNVFADYTFRTLHVTRGDETRKIEHLHYTAWPDHGIPLYTHSVVTYLKKLLATSTGIGPVIMHCSAGVGRTGTIILCDICLRRAAVEGVVDVLTETQSIRNQRVNMVDNKQQYLFAHLVLVECLLSLPTALPCNDNLPAKIQEMKKQLSLQIQRLENTAWQDAALRPTIFQMRLSERNLAKNRYPELVLSKVNRVYLKRYPPADEDSDYISAVYVDGVRVQNQYLATQLPLPITFNDFWRMVAEFKVELIIMLQPIDPDDNTCCPIAPRNGEFKPTPYINVITKDITEMEYYTSRKLVLMDKSQKPVEEQSVTILSCTEWAPGRNKDPPTSLVLVTLWQAAERVSRGDGPAVILCHDGVTGCGLYLALSFLLERMAVERECDVCLAIRAVRRSRPDFVRSFEHMEYLYDAALTYLEYFETYANFS